MTRLNFYRDENYTDLIASFSGDGGGSQQRYQPLVIPTNKVSEGGRGEEEARTGI